jgi:hypothetical protein
LFKILPVLQGLITSLRLAILECLIDADFWRQAVKLPIKSFSVCVSSCIRWDCGIAAVGSGTVAIGSGSEPG